jgi:hypothetical protein
MTGKINVDVPHISQYGAHEGGGEILWPSNIKFRIDRFADIGGTTFFYMTEIGP